MARRVILHPYKNGLGGMGLVKQHLKDHNIVTIEKKATGSKLKQRVNDFNLQWGNPQGGKDVQIQRMLEANVPTLESTNSRDQAREWIENGFPVVCRTILNGHSGAGIVIADSVDQLVSAPLYTKYQKKQREFRVHVYALENGEHRFFVSEKKMRARERRDESFDARIRNHSNGWVFARTDLQPFPDDLFQVATAALVCFDLKFAAIDLGWHASRGCFIFEVNTAPGCDNATAEFYAETILEDMNHA